MKYIGCDFHPSFQQIAMLEPYMKYIGCDFHPSFQQIAMLDLKSFERIP